MRFHKLTLTAIAAFLVLSACVVTTIPGNPANTSSPASAAAAESFITPTSGGSIGQLLNNARRANGLAALTQDARLTAAAQAHAQDMVSNGFFTHVGSNGSSVTDRLRRQGYRSCLAAENISQGFSDSSQTMQSWMNSPPHRVNNLRRGVSQYGVGQVGSTVVLVLANPC